MCNNELFPFSKRTISIYPTTTIIKRRNPFTMNGEEAVTVTVTMTPTLEKRQKSPEYNEMKNV